MGYETSRPYLSNPTDPGTSSCSQSFPTAHVAIFGRDVVQTVSYHPFGHVVHGILNWIMRSLGVVLGGHTRASSVGDDNSKGPYRKDLLAEDSDSQLLFCPLGLSRQVVDRAMQQRLCLMPIHADNHAWRSLASKKEQLSHLLPSMRST